MDATRLVLVEAESFDALGGWALDQQFMDQMGSPYLLAHGLGRPVANAKASISVERPGHYRLWVRTRDWAPPHGPGVFRVLVDGVPAAKRFGEGGDGSWAWSDGGIVRLGSIAELELEDLTGFEGRCDALLFVPASESFSPPDGGPELALLRRLLLGLPDKAPDAGRFDFVVAGGGYAGVCAALAAARAGLKTALIHDRPVLGGNASGEVRVGPIGGLDEGLFPRNGDIAKELLAASKGHEKSSGGIRPRPDDDAVRRLVEAEPNVSLFLETRVVGVERDGSAISAAIAKSVRDSKELRFPGSLFADCTGDACLGHLAGASWMLGREGREQTGEPLAPPKSDSMLLGVSNYWLAKRTGRQSSFPACPWALNVDGESVEVSAPKYPPKIGDCAYAAGWNWESGFKRDQIAGGEAVRDHNFRAMYGTWDYLKNRSLERESFKDAELEWASFIMGKRESRRLVGDLVLAQNDMDGQGRRIFPDACVTATWYFDLHYPHPLNSRHFPGEEYRSIAYDDPNFESLRGSIPGSFTELKPYPVPYRCFYSKDMANLFMAGRNISVTHAALAPVRTMNTTAMMGTVVGRAAALCSKLRVTPRELYGKRLDDLLKALANPSIIERSPL